MFYVGGGGCSVLCGRGDEVGICGRCTCDGYVRATPTLDGPGEVRAGESGGMKRCQVPLFDSSFMLLRLLLVCVCAYTAFFSVVAAVN